MVVLLLLSMILIMTRERVARNFVSQVFLSSWPALQPGRFPPMSSCGIGLWQSVKSKVRFFVRLHATWMRSPSGPSLGHVVPVAKESALGLLRRIRRGFAPAWMMEMY